MIGVLKLSIRSSPRLNRAPGRGGDSGFFEDPGGKNSVAYSGEIYNYRELRAELEKEGFKFISGLDSELVLAPMPAGARPARKSSTGNGPSPSGTPKNSGCSAQGTGSG